MAVNHRVGGSNPSRGAKNHKRSSILAVWLYRLEQVGQIFVGTPRPLHEIARIVDMGTVRTIDAVRESGLNLTVLAADMGVHRTRLAHARRIGYLPQQHLVSLRESLYRRGTALIAAADAGEINLEGMKIAPIAEKMGLTQQALSEFLRFEHLMPTYRRKQLLKLQRQIGEKFVRLAAK